jgi:ATP-dependent exoDNAse (exonuclease V) beta subunit
MNDTMNQLPDQNARDTIATDLDKTLFVEAAAGTGKTTELVNRMVALVASGRAELENMVAVTFTEAAAGELKLRLREKIEEARRDAETTEEALGHFDTALSQLELAHIGTIHGFCGDLLREYPIEAGIDPIFQVVATDESTALQDRALDAWFQAILEDPPEGVRRALRRRPFRYDEAPSTQLRFAARSLAGHRDFPARWTQGDFDREGRIDGVMRVLGTLGELGQNAYRPSSRLAQHFQDVNRFVEEILLRERAMEERDYDEVEAELKDLKRRRSWTYKGFGDDYAEGVSREKALEQSDLVKADLDAFVEDADADLAAKLQEDLEPAIEGYERLKEREGRLDFLDLLIRVRNMIVEHDEVRLQLQERFTHFFVDEFQDTDPLQVEILMLLASSKLKETDYREAEPKAGKLFIVGDPKQSIYRFRRADVMLYEQTKAHLEGYGAEVLHLTTSFRGVPEIQDCVNAAFEPHMRGAEDGSQATYVALNPKREDWTDQPSLVALPVPRPYSRFGQVRNYAIEQSYPDGVGAFVEWLLNESGWQVTERDDPNTPQQIKPRHVCILFRRYQSFFQDVTRNYVRALEARHVPHVLVGGRSFHEQEEVLAVRNALTAIEWPDDTLRVYATLRGPLFAFGDDVLLAFRHQSGGSLHPLRELDRDALDETTLEVAEALEMLGRLHARRNSQAISTTVSDLLDRVRAQAAMAIGANGDQALANLFRMIERGHRFERRGASSFRAFVELLETEAESGAAQDAALIEEGTEGVRMMTAHRAKGLEFPVVILADPTCNSTRAPNRFTDVDKRLWAEPLCGAAPRDLLDNTDLEAARDAAEAIRVAYVASTRARDLLVVPVVGDDELEGWLEVLNPAIYPQPDKKRAAEEAPGCPKFGSDSVRTRPRPKDGGPAESVMPGLHKPALGAHHVVWWDPHLLELDKERRAGLRHQKVLEADPEAKADTRYEDWRRNRDKIIDVGKTPTIRVHAPSEVGIDLKDSDVPIEIIELDREPDRPSGARFGSLVHTIFSRVDFNGSVDDVRMVVNRQTLQFGAPPAEREAAYDVVQRALKHPLMQEAARSSDVKRETPLMYVNDAGELVEGIVDMAFRTDDGWTVVDFKTDEDLDAQRGAYLGQIRLYTEGVGLATGCVVRGLLLAV